MDEINKQCIEALMKIANGKHDGWDEIHGIRLFAQQAIIEIENTHSCVFTESPKIDRLTGWHKIKKAYEIYRDGDSPWECLSFYDWVSRNFAPPKSIS